MYARHTKNMENTIGDITIGLDYILDSHKDNKVQMRKLNTPLPKGFSVDGWFSNFYNYHKKPRPIKVKKLIDKFVKCLIPISFPGKIFRNKSETKKLNVSYNPGSISDHDPGLN